MVAEPDTVVPSGMPQPQFCMPVSDEACVANVVSRHIVHPQPRHRLPVDPTLAVLDQLVHGILQGTDLSPLKPEVTRILSSQNDKARIVEALVRNHDLHRVNLLVQVRAKQEALLHEASQRGDLTVPESLALLRMADSALTQVAKTLTAEKAGTGGSGGGESAASTLEKVDATRAQRDERRVSRFAGTTPHGREIIRRRLYRLKQAQAPAPTDEAGA